MSHLPKKSVVGLGLVSGGGKHRKNRHSIHASTKQQIVTADVLDIEQENTDTHFGLAPEAVDEAPVP